MKPLNPPKTMVIPRLRCLHALARETSRNHWGEYYVPFRTIQDHTGYERRVVRRHVRALRGYGFATYSNGLWSGNDPAGAGYCITRAGMEYLINCGRAPGDPI